MLNAARKCIEINSDSESVTRSKLFLIKTGCTEGPPAELSLYQAMLKMWTVTFVASRL